MPELPEVETVRRGLAKFIAGRKILKVNVLNEKSFETSPRDAKNFVLGAKIIAVRRRAKVLILDLSTNYSLVIHLKMTGQIVVRKDNKNWGAGHPTESFVAKLPDRSTRVELDLDSGMKLFFNDQRKFGWIKLVPTAEVVNLDFIKKLGPEMADWSGDFAINHGQKFDEKSAQKEFIARARRHQNSPVKAVILDQTVVSGIGNIYADESLWGAKIHPAEKVKNLSDMQLRKIFREAVVAMDKSLMAGGSTMQNYVKADGSRGNYLDLFANVFAREGQPCPRCGTEIIKIKVAGRGTHICPKCQKLKTEQQHR